MRSIGFVTTFGLIICAVMAVQCRCATADETPDGSLLHFDVLVPSGTNSNQAVEFAAQIVGGIDPEIEVEKCDFYHCENPSAEVQESIRLQGFHILPLSNCATKSATRWLGRT